MRTLRRLALSLAVGFASLGPVAIAAGPACAGSSDHAALVIDTGGQVLEYCVAHQLRLLAFRPLGGSKGHRRIANDPVLSEIAARHDATPQEIVLAWLVGLSRFCGQLGALASIGAYVLAVGAQPSVVRAGVSGALGSLAWLAARSADR